MIPLETFLEVLKALIERQAAVMYEFEPGFIRIEGYESAIDDLDIDTAYIGDNLDDFRVFVLEKYETAIQKQEYYTNHPEIYEDSDQMEEDNCLRGDFWEGQAQAWDKIMTYLN